LDPLQQGVDAAVEGVAVAAVETVEEAEAVEGAEAAEGGEAVLDSWSGD
jgi:hypothetical protein